MALIGKREDLIHVPWSSTEEWLQVYKQIYSGDLEEQTKAYETLLVWKARIPKLPVGVECTLALIQICLRDREWTPKISSGEMSISYENDLRMMYSTVIMKFLNHISNIAHTKQTSLFIIAKQLNIPDWIVDLRHDTAHGHELPSIDVMRIVANILLTWLHEEYWAAETKNLQQSQDLEESVYFESEDDEKLIDLIELWTAIGLYIKTNHFHMADLPDTEIRETIKSLFNDLSSSAAKKLTLAPETELSTIYSILVNELSRNITKGDSLLRREKLVIDSILNNEAFLASSEILSIFIDEKEKKVKNKLPVSLVNFWKDFLLLLQEKKLLLSLFLELLELIKREKDKNKKLLASLWVKTIAQAFNKLKIAQHLYQKLELKHDSDNYKLSSKILTKTVQEDIDKEYPKLKNVLMLNINGEFPNCLSDETFIRRLILYPNEFAEHYIPEILKISSFLDEDSEAKEKLLTLMKVHSIAVENEKMEVDNSDKVYTVQDLKELQKKKNSKKTSEGKSNLADNKIRSTKWKIASDDYDWSSSPIGVLPCQINDYQQVDPLIVPPEEVHFAIVKNVELPKIIDSNRLRLHSKIQWENLVKKKKRTKKKSKTDNNNTNVVESIEK